MAVENELGIQFNAMSIEMDSSADIALHHAVLRMDLDKVKQLVESGVDVNATENHTKNTPLHFFNYTYPLEVQQEMLRFFLDREASLSASKVKGPTVAGQFFRFGKLNLIKVMLEYEIDWSAKGEDGTTLLHQAAGNENPGIIELFEGRNFDVNACDNNLRTPIWYAAEIANFDAVKFLLKKGADVTSKNSFGYTGFLWGFFECCQNSKSWDNWKKCTDLFLSYGADCEHIVKNHHHNGPWGIFDQVLSEECFELIEPVLTHLAKQLVLGKKIKKYTLSKINFFEDYQNCFAVSIQTIAEMKSKVINEVTLLDLLDGDDRQIMRFAQNKDCSEELKEIVSTGQPKDPYAMRILRKRLDEAFKLVKWREQCIKCIAKITILGSNLDVVEAIVRFLNLQEMKNVCKAFERQ